MIVDDVLESVVALDDPLGVVSIYVGVRPEEQAAHRPGWELELRHGLEDAQARLQADGDAERAWALRDRLQALEEELELIASPRESGQGRALFAGLSGGETVRVSLREPFVSRVVVGGCALLRPLAAAVERSRPAGLVLVSGEDLRVCEWRPGELEELRSIPVPEPDRRQLLGPSAARPRSAGEAGPGFHSVRQRDLYERRADAARAHALAHAADLAALAGRRGWDELVLGGDEALSAGLLAQLDRQDRLEVVHEPRLLGWLPPAELAEAIAPRLEQERKRRQLSLLEQVRGAAASGGRGALGLAETLGVLAEGRVDALLLPEERELRGLRAHDGTLFPPHVAPPGAAPDELVVEPLLAERMIQGAAATDARVTILGGDAEAALGRDEAGALLRW